MLRIIALAVLFAVVFADVAPLLHADNLNVIDGSYIVILHENLSILDRDSHILALQDQIITNNEADSEIGWSYSMGSLIGFSARLNKKLLGEQLAHPDVKYIEADQTMSINYQQNERSPAAVVTQTGATWGLARTSKRALPVGTTYIYSTQAGGDTTVFVIDTGILTTHNDFGGRARSGFNAITNESPQDLNGHGTHCAGTVGGRTYGISKNTNLVSVKVLSGSGSGSNAGVIAGVQYVRDNGVPNRDVGSMSLGGGLSTTLNQAVAQAVSRGITMVVAAGNDNSNACSYSPASEPSAITVGATTSADARSSFSNYGNCLDVFAPGSLITSDWIGSNSATSTISGTSMACPHVAGVAALTISRGLTANPTATRNWIVSNGTPNILTSVGTNSPNILLFSAPA